MSLNIKSQAGPATDCPGSRLGVTGLVRMLAGIMFLMMLKENDGQAGQSVSMDWQPNPSSETAGYNIYYGTTSGVYTNSVDAGNVASVTIGGLVSGTIYYFAATTYNIDGRESGFSNEATYAVPVVVTTNVLATMAIRSAPAGQFLLTITGPVNQGYAIEATEDFLTWTVIGTVAIGAAGSLDFTDTDAANFPLRFYRTRETP